MFTQQTQEYFGNNNQELILICDSNEACYQSSIYLNNYVSLIELCINGIMHKISNINNH